MSILWCIGVIVLMQVSGESSGFIKGKTSSWSSWRFLRSHKSVLHISRILWMMQAQLELYKPLINYKNPRKPSTPSTSCLKLPKTPKKWTPEDAPILLQDPQNLLSCVLASLSNHTDPKEHLKWQIELLFSSYQGFIIFSMLIF